MPSMWNTDPKYVDSLGRYYGKLTGGIIKSVTFEKDEFDDLILWPTLTIEFADGVERKVYVQADEEGNSEGFLSGIPHEWD